MDVRFTITTEDKTGHSYPPPPPPSVVASGSVTVNASMPLFAFRTDRRISSTTFEVVTVVGAAAALAFRALSSLAASAASAASALANSVAAWTRGSKYGYEGT